MPIEEGRIFMGRFGFKEDLLLSILQFSKENEIKWGIFSIIGALTKAKMGYYDQTEKKYVECVNLDKKLEITTCNGNISMKDGEIFVHAHISLADHQGQCFGGHLMPGSIIFAAEYYIKELTGCSLERTFDPQTGLSLW